MRATQTAVLATLQPQAPALFPDLVGYSSQTALIARLAAAIPSGSATHPMITPAVAPVGDIEAAATANAMATTPRDTIPRIRAIRGELDASVDPSWRLSIVLLPPFPHWTGPVSRPHKVTEKPSPSGGSAHSSSATISWIFQT